MNRPYPAQLNTETKSEWSTPIYQYVSTPEFTWLQVRLDERSELEAAV